MKGKNGKIKVEIGQEALSNMTLKEIFKAVLYAYSEHTGKKIEAIARDDFGLAASSLYSLIEQNNYNPSIEHVKTLTRISGSPLLLEWLGLDAGFAVLDCSGNGGKDKTELYCEEVNTQARFLNMIIKAMLGDGKIDIEEHKKLKPIAIKMIKVLSEIVGKNEVQTDRL